MENVENLISKLKEAGLDEVAEKTILVGWLRNRQVEVTVLDRGRSDPERWSISARVLNGPDMVGGESENTHSNSHADLDFLIADFNWDGVR